MSKDQIEDLHEIGAIDNAKFQVPGVGDAQGPLEPNICRKPAEALREKLQRSIQM